MYAFNSDSYASHQQVLEILRALPSRSRILDVGAARGFLGERLVGHDFHLVGIEKDGASAHVAARWYQQFLTADIEAAGVELPGQYDAIVLADVLEHLRDPLSVLVRLRQQLAAGGQLIVSVPNVAHITVRLALLFGRFDYTDRGILDRTHLRFFTWKSVQNLLLEAGLTVHSVRVTPAPLPLVFPSTGVGHPWHFLHRLNWLLARTWKRLFAYQFILVMVPGLPAEDGRRRA